MTGGRAAGYALLGCGGLLLVLAVLSGWSGAQRIGSREHDTRAVASAASAFVAAYGTFDHRDPDAYTARLVALTGGALRDALARASVSPDAAPRQRATPDEEIESHGLNDSLGSLRRPSWRYCQLSGMDCSSVSRAERRCRRQASSTRAMLRDLRAAM